MTPGWTGTRGSGGGIAKLELDIEIVRDFSSCKADVVAHRQGKARGHIELSAIRAARAAIDAD